MAARKAVQNENDQAARIPTDPADGCSGMEAEITRAGDETPIRPPPHRLEGVTVKFAAFSDDFMAQERDKQTEGTRGPL